MVNLKKTKSEIIVGIFCFVFVFEQHSSKTYKEIMPVYEFFFTNVLNTFARFWVFLMTSEVLSVKTETNYKKPSNTTRSQCFLNG